MIAIINYGAGNLYSISKALEGLGTKVKVTDSPETVKSADAVVLPGVGAFDEAIKNLARLQLIPAIKKSIGDGKPFFGICLGIQLLFSESEEGNLKGLDIIKGKVRRFKLTRPDGHRGEVAKKIPHMGWNQVRCKKEVPIWRNLSNPSWMYFAHSFYPEPRETEVIAALTDYGTRFASMIWKNNVFGTQFHPEKSGRDGLLILKNFIEMIK